MKEVSEGAAGVIGVISTLAFACLVWWYFMQGSSEITMFIVVGVLLLLANLFALWCLCMKTTKNKKGKK
jgi:uncharacterized membrane protein YqjE